MPYMLQPHQYTQIARPNLYNVAYRRVGAYKGMGRLHPTNYLEIGPRPNRIGNTTGQYNTLSGQLSLFPPSLRGLGQDSSTTTITLPGFTTLPDQSTAPYSTNVIGGQYSVPVGTGVTTPTTQWFQQYGVYLALGVGALALLLGGRR